MRQHLVTPQLLAALGLLAALLPRAAAQSITANGSLGTRVTLSGSNNTISLGRQVDGNLFHSFGIFGLATGESATFTGPAGIANIIDRVTGGSPTSIESAAVESVRRQPPWTGARGCGIVEGIGEGCA
ncbi:MAG TPA: hypothetical protein VM755_02660 [Stellaceae bacterium]|nr:hypothetical protein [Stellaceae bacterium]